MKSRKWYVDECVILYFRSILFQLWWCEMGVRESLPGRFDLIGSKYLRDHTTHDVIVTSYRWWRKDASPNSNKPFIHASNLKYTTGDACSLQRSDVNFRLFLALRHASHIITGKREMAKLLTFQQTEERIFQKKNPATIRFHNKWPSIIAKDIYIYVD